MLKTTLKQNNCMLLTIQGHYYQFYVQGAFYINGPEIRLRYSRGTVIGRANDNAKTLV